MKKNNIFNFEILNEIFWVWPIFLGSDGHVISVQGNKKYFIFSLMYQKYVWIDFDLMLIWKV